MVHLPDEIYRKIYSYLFADCLKALEDLYIRNNKGLYFLHEYVRIKGLDRNIYSANGCVNVFVGRFI
jgi:hypothetical protein